VPYLDPKEGGAPAQIMPRKNPDALGEVSA